MEAEKETASKLWSKACSVIRAKITERAFSQWFEGIVPLRIEDHKIILGSGVTEQSLGQAYHAKVLLIDPTVQTAVRMPNRMNANLA